MDNIPSSIAQFTTALFKTSDEEMREEKSAIAQTACKRKHTNIYQEGMGQETLHSAPHTKKKLLTKYEDVIWSEDAKYQTFLKNHYPSLLEFFVTKQTKSNLKKAKQSTQDTFFSGSNATYPKSQKNRNPTSICLRNKKT